MKLEHFKIVFARDNYMNIIVCNPIYLSRTKYVSHKPLRYKYKTGKKLQKVFEHMHVPMYIVCQCGNIFADGGITKILLMKITYLRRKFTYQ